MSSSRSAGAGAGVAACPIYPAPAEGTGRGGIQPMSLVMSSSYQYWAKDGVEGTGVLTAIGTVGKKKVGQVAKGMVGGHE